MNDFGDVLPPFSEKRNSGRETGLLTKWWILFFNMKTGPLLGRTTNPIGND
jgi:hypothetical protein